MTLDVYAQLEQRADRSHGTTFDDLLRRAKQRLGDAEWDTFGDTRRPNGPARRGQRAPRRKEKACGCRLFGNGETRTRTGDTTIFSGPKASALAPRAV
jgi:hypothetical protein